MQEDRYLTTEEVQRRLRISRRTLYRYRGHFQDFPRPFKTSGAKLLWDAGEVDRWLAKRRDKR